MKTMAFLFPGVGSQYVGMGRSLYDSFKIFKETIEEAGDILKLEMSELFFSPARQAELDQLENAQSALLAASIAVYRVFKQEIGLQPHYCMGHSLGEYSALCAAGVIPFADALRLVRQRGLIVNEVSAALDGTMAWVVNLDWQVVDKLCRQRSRRGEEVYVSAYDSPSQTSISGHTGALMSTARELEKEGAIVYPLKLSGPFHCPLMQGAAEKMVAVLKEYKYEEPQYPVIANRQARPYDGGASVVDNLSQQLISPIRWQASLNYLIQQGVEIAVEMGPKNVLKFLVRKNTSAIHTYITDKSQDLQSIQAELVLKEGEYLRTIGKCLGAAVGTRNRRGGGEAYEREVVAPYRKMETLFQELRSGGSQPRPQHVRDAVRLLQLILVAKRVPQQEQAYWLNHVYGGKLLKGV